MSDLLCLFFTFFHKFCSDFDDDVPAASVFIWKVSCRLFGIFFFNYLWACFSKVILCIWAGNCPHDCALVRRIRLQVYHPSLHVRGHRHNCAVDDNGHIMLTRGNSSQWRWECFRKKNAAVLFLFIPRFLQNNSLWLISKHAFSGLHNLRRL